MVDVTSFRSVLEQRDRAYIMELDFTAERIAEIKKFQSGSSRRKITDLSVPIIMPQVESAVAYQTGVFLTSYPIFGVAAPPKYQDQAIQLETIMGNHSLRFGWVRELIKTFRNGFKYNFAPTYINWRKVPSKGIVTSKDPSMAGLAQVIAEQQQGNAIESIDPYNCIMDMMVPPAEYHERGSFFGWTKYMNRMELLRFVRSLDDTKTTSFNEAFASQYAGLNSGSMDPKGYFVPQVNLQFNMRSIQPGSTNWLEYVGLPSDNNKIQYRGNYLVTKFICRALPSDFGKKGPGSNTPTIYLGIIINWCHVIYVEEILSVDDTLPVFIMQPNEDGLGYQTHSMLDTALPFQDMSSALWNITLESKRRLVYDRLLYNPRLVNKEDIDTASSVARIPIRNAAASTDISKAVFAMPYREDNAASNLQMSEFISGMADQAVGQNKVDRGQFQKGNKTKTEFETVQGNSNSRQQLVSLTVEGQFFTPIKSTLKNNILLNQGAAELMNQDKGDVVKVDPAQLRSALLSFKTTDGLLPTDKLFSPELLTVFLQTAQAMPVLMTEYDVMGMFTYWAKLKGANWLEDFKRDPQAQQKFLGNLKATAQANSSLPPEQNPQPQAAQ